MEQLHANCSASLSDLQGFVDALPDKYKQGAPALLQHVKLLPTVLANIDLDFATNSQDNVVVKLKMITEATFVLMDKIGPYVGEEFMDWFKGQCKRLKWRMKALNMNMASIRLSGNIPQISILPGGASSVNTGVCYGVNCEHLITLQEMFKLLMDGS